MKNQDILSIVELALGGNTNELTHFVENMAIKASNSGKRSLYRELNKLLDKHTSEQQSNYQHTTSSLNIDNDVVSLPLPNEIWLPKATEHKIDSFLKIQNYSKKNQSKQKLNRLLLYGPPGTGKTTLGFLIAKRLNFSINYVRLSDVISPKFGETMKNISNIFQNSKEKIIFIDEFDAFGKARTDTNDVGELKRIVNSLIQTLDLYASEKIIIVSTNLVETIDPAVLRRFPFKISVDKLGKDSIISFLNFLIEKYSDKKIKLSKESLTALIDVIMKTNLKTIDQVQQLFDKAVIVSDIQKSNVVTISHFVEGLLLTGVFNELTIRELHKKSPDTVGMITKNLKKQGYTQSFIAEMLNIHRNTMRDYVK